MQIHIAVVGQQFSPTPELSPTGIGPGVWLITGKYDVSVQAPVTHAAGIALYAIGADLFTFVEAQAEADSSETASFFHFAKLVVVTSADLGFYAQFVGEGAASASGVVSVYLAAEKVG